MNKKNPILLNNAENLFTEAQNDNFLTLEQLFFSSLNS
jgi:hypothetical protein